MSNCKVLSGARPNLNIRKPQKLEEFITELQDIFSTMGDDYGRMDSILPHRHRRRPSDSAAPHRLLLDKQAEVRELLKDMKELGEIEESVIPWASPIVLVHEKNRDPRLCVD